MTQITCTLMSEMKLKTAPSNLNMPDRGVTIQGLLLFLKKLISGKRLLPSERGFSVTSCAPTSPIVIMSLSGYNQEFREKCDAKSQ